MLFFMLEKKSTVLPNEVAMISDAGLCKLLVCFCDPFHKGVASRRERCFHQFVPVFACTDGKVGGSETSHSGSAARRLRRHHTQQSSSSSWALLELELELELELPQPNLQFCRVA
jgi:hypothetical protein